MGCDTTTTDKRKRDQIHHTQLPIGVHGVLWTSPGSPDTSDVWRLTPRPSVWAVSLNDEGLAGLLSHVDTTAHLGGTYPYGCRVSTPGASAMRAAPGLVFPLSAIGRPTAATRSERVSLRNPQRAPALSFDSGGRWRSEDTDAPLCAPVS
jgi:hypothetical protein